MRTRMTGPLAASLMLFAISCDKPTTAPPSAQQAKGHANTGQITIHVEGMTQKLDLT